MRYKVKIFVLIFIIFWTISGCKSNNTQTTNSSYKLGNDIKSITFLDENKNELKDEKDSGWILLGEKNIIQITLNNPVDKVEIYTRSTGYDVKPIILATIDGKNIKGNQINYIWNPKKIHLEEAFGLFLIEAK